MTVFRVWAPRAKQVELVSGGQNHQMTSEDRGWWALDLPDAKAGMDYQFRLDGGMLLPDPRSNNQPEGVHGPSRLVDHSAFDWEDEGWQAKPLREAVIYELHVGTYTPEGTFEAIIGKLDHLVDLGITHIELMPVAEFPDDRGWGYDGVDLYAPQKAYGGPEGLKRLVNACHRKGLAVLLDVVYNHFGPDGNYLAQFGPYFTDRYSTPWGDAVNFDGPGSDEVRRFFLDNALYWLSDYHMDGLRLDAVHTIFDMSATHILEQTAVEVKELSRQFGRPLVLIVESDLNNSRLVSPLDQGGYGIDAQWMDDFRHSLHTTLTGEQNGFHGDFRPFQDLAKSIKQGFVYTGQYSAYRDRAHGRPMTGIMADHLIGFLQNHDQVGNRAIGERENHLLSPGLYKIGAALLLSSPFVPMLFEGEEWAASTPFLYFVNFKNRELALAVSKGRKMDFAAFGWDPDSIPDPKSLETFQRSKLKWEEVNHQPYQQVLDWYKQLIALRKSQPDLTSGWEVETSLQFDEQARWILLRRGSIYTLCNLGGGKEVIPLQEADRSVILLSSTEQAALQPKGVDLAPESVVIVKVPAS